MRTRVIQFSAFIFGALSMTALLILTTEVRALAGDVQSATALGVSTTP